MMAPPLDPKNRADSNPLARNTAIASALCSAIVVLTRPWRRGLRELPRRS